MLRTDLVTIYIALSSLVSLPQIRTQTAAGGWVGRGVVIVAKIANLIACSSIICSSSLGAV